MLWLWFAVGVVALIVVVCVIAAVAGRGRPAASTQGIARGPHDAADRASASISGGGPSDAETIATLRRRGWSGQQVAELLVTRSEKAAQQEEAARRVEARLSSDAPAAKRGTMSGGPVPPKRPW